MKSALIFLFSLCLSGHSYSQRIIGQVSGHGQEFPLATVILLGKDSILIKGVLTNDQGKYSFDVKSGSYTIVVSALGYLEYRSPEFTVEQADIEFPDIILEETSLNLDEIEVIASRNLFEQRDDRLVINVQNTIASSGNTVLEILQKSPGVMVNRQASNIALNGKSGVRIMIDGKMVQLPPDVVMQMLDAMNSSNVDRIEIISEPPVRYDADGVAGIVNIITKQHSNIGTNASIGLTAGFKWAEVTGGNFALNHRSSRFAYFFDYSILNTHNYHITKVNRQSPDDPSRQIMSSSSDRKNVTTQQNLNAGIEWKVSKKSILELYLTGYRRNWYLDAVTWDTNNSVPDRLVTTKMKISELNVWQSATAGMGFQSRIDAKSEISASLDYLYFHNNNPSNYNNLESTSNGSIRNWKIDLQKTTPIKTAIGKIDFTTSPFMPLTIETGVKFVTTRLDNNILVKQLTNTEWVVDPLFTSYSALDEKIGAGYLSARWQQKENLKIYGGVRYEYTHTTIGTPMQKDFIDRKYCYWFPGFTIQKKMGNEGEIYFGYSRRLTRPTYNDIAPFVFFWSPNTFSAGNTSLFPAISDGVKLGFHWMQWESSINYNRIMHEIITMFQPEKDGHSENQIYRPQNLKSFHSWVLTNSTSVDVSSWCEAQISLIMQYQQVQTSHLTQNVNLSLLTMQSNLTTVMRFYKDIVFEISGNYQSRSFYGMGQFQPIGSLNAGIQKKFRHGTVKLSMDDILYTNVWRIHTDLPENDLYSDFTYDWHNQYVRLTYTLNFGNGKLNSVKQGRGSEEERRRVQ